MVRLICVPPCVFDVTLDTDGVKEYITFLGNSEGRR
jgi:hypothetical protein